MKLIEITEAEYNRLGDPLNTYFSNGCIFDEETDNLIAFSWYASAQKQQVNTTRWWKNDRRRKTSRNIILPEILRVPKETSFFLGYFTSTNESLLL